MAREEAHATAPTCAVMQPWMVQYTCTVHKNTERFISNATYRTNWFTHKARSDPLPQTDTSLHPLNLPTAPPCVVLQEALRFCKDLDTSP